VKMIDYDTLRLFWEYDAIQDWGKGGCWYHLIKGTKKQGIWYECDSWILWKDGRGYVGFSFRNDHKKNSKNNRVVCEIKSGIIGGYLVNNGDFCDGGYGVDEYVNWLLE